jgi:hypothetical protein
VWEGVVHVFDLEGHPKAPRAYAWSSPIEGSTKRRFFAVLHIPPIVSPLDAVRAEIVAEHKARQKGRGGFEPPTSLLVKGRLCRWASAALGADSIGSLVPLSWGEFNVVLACRQIRTLPGSYSP